MYLINKTLCFLFLGFLLGDIFPQEQYYISTNGNINNSFSKRGIYNVSYIPPLKNKNSIEVLDSLICVLLNGNKIKFAYNYNEDLTLDYFTMADWFNGEWIFSAKHKNTYNFEGKLETILWEWFQASSGEWIKDAKVIFIYDSLGNKIASSHQVYDGQKFINYFKDEYYYNAANNLLSSVHQNWIDSIWVNRSKIVWSFTPENVNDTTLFQVWTNAQWVNYQLNIYEYDEKLNIISNLAKRWLENNWANIGMGSFEYDVNNNCMLNIWKIANNNTWENWFRIFYEYDENNNLIHLFGEEWENGQWVPEDEPLSVTNPDGIVIGFIAKELFLHYNPPTSVEGEKNEVNGFNLFQNYPNPFNPNTIISYNIQDYSLVTLNIYNLLGEKIRTLIQQNQAPGKYQINFDGDNLPGGIYFYELITDKIKITKKMILLR